MIRTLLKSIAVAILPVCTYAQDLALNQEEMQLTDAVSVFEMPDEDPPVAMPGGVYKLNWKYDAPITAVGSAWSLYAFTQIYNKPSTPVAEIEALDKNNINGFDRWAAGRSNNAADDNSDFIFYGAMPYPLVLLADKEIRKDAPKIGFLYLEAMAITGLFYTGSTYFTNRFRPEAYNTSIPAKDRTNGGMRNSFLAGHVALVATSTFFTAKVYNDYHPGSTWSYVLWGTAAAATGTTIYLRHIAGKHFPTDIIVGTALGIGSGILVPHLHKNKVKGNEKFSFSPFISEETYGLTFRYNIR